MVVNKRTLGICISMAAVLLVVVILIVSWGGKEPNESDISSTVQTSMLTTTTTQISKSPRYTLGEWEDKLALFESSSTSPSIVYDVYLSSLPEEEQQRLRKGIPVDDDKTLASLLEDYTS